ncbi:V-type ATP synthase subunit E protein [Halorhabdus tiamatea SARL4B]|uniref:A-type ATP synthase subunit E n=1 Tax=Halorhabdus tiamatea SARL4B TaxID=1033806 RepID=F7PNM9_9EURY|nr:V-type ATP synthase subunit E [Halorhabdus tiamatea]ERJ05276.1 V-type ATP synthase subunit E protein [Halorhabdus tiamatea SARL4B]CCQ33735.1 V-type ATP synthase subunit E [Halorhabdus tiamatea SARL4B]
MSLEVVVEDIKAQAREQAEEITQAAESDAEEIVADAESDAEEIKTEREREVDRQIAQERERRISSAELEAKQERLEARREVLETVRERVESELANLDGERREELTRDLLESALEEFEGAVDVYGRAEDAALLEEIVADYDATLAGERDCLGGVVVESSASRVRVNNTFDSILEGVWEDEIRSISERLFEDVEALDGDVPEDDTGTTEQ